MERYVRFSSNLPGSKARTPLGVFHAASKIMESDAMDPWSAGRAEEVFRWFNAHLTAPHLDASHEGALFWFREECRDMVRRLWELVHVLRETT